MVAPGRPVVGRLFVAWRPGPGSLRRLAELQRELRPLLPRAAWVRPETFHLTLRFLGDQPEPRWAAAREALEATAAGSEPFPLSLLGGGAFPHARRPRVLWVGLESGGRLEALAAELERALVERGFPPADKPFRAHLTLCRIRRPGPRAPAALLELGELGRDHVGELVLLRSTLLPRGARHEPLHRVTLGGAA